MKSNQGLPPLGSSTAGRLLLAARQLWIPASFWNIVPLAMFCCQDLGEQAGSVVCVTTLGIFDNHSPWPTGQCLANFVSVPVPFGLTPECNGFCSFLASMSRWIGGVGPYHYYCCWHSRMSCKLLGRGIFTFSGGWFCGRQCSKVKIMSLCEIARIE